MIKSILNIRFRIIHLAPLLILFACYMAVGQEDSSQRSSESTLDEIYDQVWLPFMESYRALDIDQFKALQAKDLTKVAIDRNSIQPTEVYFKEIEGFFNQFKQMNRQMDIKFSILSTALGTDKVYQTGYYVIGSRNADSEPFQTMGYGYFTVVIIKTEDGWKISLDADKRAQIDKEEFRKSGLIYELND